MKILLIKDTDEIKIEKGDLPDYDIVETFFSYTKEQSLDIIDKMSFDAIVIKVKNQVDLSILEHIKKNVKDTKIILIPPDAPNDFGSLN